MKLFNQIRQDWDNFLKTVRSKRFGYTLIGLMMFVGLIFAVEYSFFLNERYRAITGITFQIVAGSALILDQVFSKRDIKIGDIWVWLSRRRIRMSMIFSLVAFLITAFVWVGLGGEKVEPAVIGGVFIWLIIVNYVYLYSVNWIVNVLEKRSTRCLKAGIESNIKQANIILFIVSLLLGLITVLFYRPESVEMIVLQIPSLMWGLVFAFIIVPVFSLSGIFLLTVLASKVFVIGREKLRNRIWFWVGIFALWLWGGLLLAANAWS